MHENKSTPVALIIRVHDNHGRLFVRDAHEVLSATLGLYMFVFSSSYVVWSQFCIFLNFVSVS